MRLTLTRSGPGSSQLGRTQVTWTNHQDTNMGEMGFSWMMVFNKHGQMGQTGDMGGGAYEPAQHPVGYKAAMGF